MKALWKLTVALWKWLVGAVLCSDLLLAIPVIGWTYRAMRRRAIRTWNRLSFEPPIDPGHWPNWLIQQDPPRRWYHFLHSAGMNIRMGIQGLFNTWVMTIPACMLWLFSWRFGWDNSFHKVYEQFWIGPLSGWLGIFLFIFAMFYVPLAQARQAISDDWRAFYDFRVIWAVARRRRWACIGLALLYSLAALPISALKIAPLAFQQTQGFELLSDQQLLIWLHTYYVYTGLALFPLFVAVHLAASKVYARGLAEALWDNEISPEALTDYERQTLRKLGLLRQRARQPSHLLVRAAGWTGSRLVGFTAGTLASIAWFLFVAQIYISEFLNYHPVLGWLNQPLVHLPSIKFIPMHLWGS